MGTYLWQSHPAEHARCTAATLKLSDWVGTDVDQMGGSTDLADRYGSERSETMRCVGTAEFGSSLCKGHISMLAGERRKAAERLLIAGDKAAAKLVGLIDSTDEKISIRAAESVLDRIGLSARHNLTVTAGAETSGFERVLSDLFDVDGHDVSGDDRLSLDAVEGVTYVPVSGQPEEWPR